MIFICGTGISGVATAQEHDTDQRLLKAAYIFNFAKFTSWPTSAWNDVSSPLTICSVGQDSLISELEKLGGKNIKDRPVNVRHIKSAQLPGNCQLLYIATSEKKRFKRIVKAISDVSILTVSQIPDSGYSGGIIELFLDKGRLKFKINLNKARKAGLTISSRLLKLAILISSEDAS